MKGEAGPQSQGCLGFRGATPVPWRKGHAPDAQRVGPLPPTWGRSDSAAP